MSVTLREDNFSIRKCSEMGFVKKFVYLGERELQKSSEIA